MIWEFQYWKQDIRKIAQRMKKRVTQSRWPERSLVNLEKDIFIAFYAIRKLAEATKLSKPIVGMKLPAFSYPSIGKGVTKLNWHRLDEHFDFGEEKPEQLSLRFVYNQIVHSYICMPQMTELSTLGGIFFCSDFKRNDRLYCLEIGEIIQCLELVAADDPSSLSMSYDSKSKDYKVTLSS